MNRPQKETAREVLRQNKRRGARDEHLREDPVDALSGRRPGCGGEPERLMAALMEYRGLTTGEIKRIQLLLEEAKKNHGDLKGKRS